ncbi:fragmin60 [Phlegmacium glaucopus]|nr:fragmin60 [Phlegmacium glaucopus]
MAHLTKPTVYNIEDSNIALLGSDLEKRVREEAGDKESAWRDAGISLGLQIWRIADFHVVPWPKEKTGSFYDGDSYIILHTFKKTPDANSFSYNLHFWLGQNTSQDEAGTAAYKTVELDDHLHGTPVQYREVQGHESPQFLSYFPRFTSLKGGVATGFHHVSDPLPLNIRKLYRITLTRAPGGSHSSLVVREVPASADTLTEGDVYVLDKGQHILQYNTKGSAGQEKFKAAEFAQVLVNDRESRSDVTVYDEDSRDASAFLREFGQGIILRKSDAPKEHIAKAAPILFRISDATGVATFERVEPATRSSLSSQDVFLVDHSSDATHPAILIWIGTAASLNERRLSIQYAQHYLYDKKRKACESSVTIPIVKMQEGEETPEFLEALGNS